MGNFSGVINSDLKVMHRDAIRALIDGVSVPCTLIYGGTKWTSCNNCIFDPIGNKSSNFYLHGGPVPFNGICPVCNGAGKIMDDSTASLNLVVMWDYKDWRQFIGPSNTAQLAEAEAMTLSEVSTYDELLKVQEVILDTTVANGYATQRFNRVGRPNLLGLGSSEFVLAFWKRIQ